MTLTESVAQNRKLLASKLKPNTICVIHSNDIYPGNSDGTLPFRQNSNIIWSTGIGQEETTLLLIPSHPDENMREILFIRHVDSNFVKWHGQRLTHDEAASISGIKTVYFDSDFENVFTACAHYAESLTINTIEHPRSENKIETKDLRFFRWLNERYPLHEIHRLNPVIAKLRVTKNPYEIWCLAKACDISKLGFERLLEFIEPEIKGRQVMAELYHEYLQHDGDWAHYEPIVASGDNTCILHYTTNSNVLADGDLVLIDAAASYKHYNADLTRTIPVNGRFNPRQKQLYNAVLSIHKQLKTVIRSGMFISDIQKICDELTMAQLCKLGLTNMDEIRRKGSNHFMNLYAYHNFGHYLGLSVHDEGNIFLPIPENAVITIEPGIYIQDEGMGVRIENNVIVTSDGAIDLMNYIPIEVEDIEDRMNI